MLLFLNYLVVPTYLKSTNRHLFLGQQHGLPLEVSLGLSLRSSKTPMKDFLGGEGQLAESKSLRLQRKILKLQGTKEMPGLEGISYSRNPYY